MIVTLPMINGLLLATPQLRRGNATRPSWLGFEVGGWAAVLAVGLLAVGVPELLFWPLSCLKPLIRSWSVTVATSFVIAVASLFYTTGQLLVAWFVGRLSTRYRVVIVRR